MNQSSGIFRALNRDSGVSAANEGEVSHNGRRDEVSVIDITGNPLEMKSIHFQKLGSDSQATVPLLFWEGAVIFRGAC